LGGYRKNDGASKTKTGYQLWSGSTSQVRPQLRRTNFLSYQFVFSQKIRVPRFSVTGLTSKDGSDSGGRITFPNQLIQKKMFTVFIPYLVSKLVQLVNKLANPARPQIVSITGIAWYVTQPNRILISGTCSDLNFEETLYRDRR